MTEDTEISALRGEALAFINMADTGEYPADCAHGRAMADKLVTRMRETGNTSMLGAICRGIIDAGRWQAVHAGFFQRLADRSLPSPH